MSSKPRGVVEKDGEKGEAVAPAGQEGAKGEVVGGGAAGQDELQPEHAQAQEDGDLHDRPHVRHPLRHLEAHHPEGDGQPGQGDGDSGLEPGGPWPFVQDGREAALQEDAVEGAREHQVDGGDPVGVVDPVEPRGQGAPARPQSLAHPEADPTLPRPGRAQLGGHEPVGHEEHDHGENPPREPGHAHAGRGGQGVEGEDRADGKEEQVEPGENTVEDGMGVRFRGHRRAILYCDP